MTKDQTLAAFLDSQDFYELMQSYRHEPLDAAIPFEAVRLALYAALAQSEHPTAAMQIAGGAVLLDYINENEAESEKRVGALTAARVFIAMQKASGLNLGAIK